MSQRYIHNYYNLNVKSCNGLDDSEKQWLRNLSSKDRFRLCINNITGATIPDNAFNINEMDKDIQTIFYKKCCEIRITNNNITSIGVSAFLGIENNQFECLTCVKIAASNLTEIQRYAFLNLKSKNNQYVSLDLSGCTSLTTINNSAFYDNSFYIIRLSSSISSIGTNAFACSSSTNLICLGSTTSNLYTQFKDTAFQNRQLMSSQTLNANLIEDNLQIINGIIYGFTPETFKMIVDSRSTHYTLNISSSSIQGIEYKALNLQDKYGLLNIVIDLNITSNSLIYIEDYGLNLLQDNNQSLTIERLDALEEVGENAVQIQSSDHILDLLTSFNLRILKANAFQINIKSTETQNATVMLPYNIERFYNNSITSYNPISLNLFPYNKYQSIMSTNSKFSSITNILENKDLKIIGEDGDFIISGTAISAYSNQALCKMYQNIYDINNQAYFKIVPSSSYSSVTEMRIGSSSISFNIKHCTQIDLRNLTSLKSIYASFVRIFYYNYDDDPSQYTNELYKFPNSLEQLHTSAFYDNCFYHTKTPIIDLSNTKINIIASSAFKCSTPTESKFDASSQCWTIKLPLSTASTINISSGAFNNIQQQTSLILSPYNDELKNNPNIDFSQTGSFYLFNIETNLNDNDILLDNTKLNIIGLTEKGIIKQSAIDTNDTNSSLKAIYCPSSALSQVTEIQNLGVNSDLNYIVDLRNLTSLKTINGDNFRPSIQQTLVSLGTDINTIKFTSQIQRPIYLWYPNIQNQVLSSSNINLAIFSPSNTLFVDFVINTNCSQNFGDTILFEGTNASSCAEFTEAQLAVMKEKCIKIEFSENSEITTIPQGLFYGLNRVTQIYDRSGKITTLENNCFATTQFVDTQVTENLANNTNASTAFTNRILTIILFNYISKFSDFTLDSNNNLTGCTIPNNKYERIYITLPQCNYTSQSYTFNDLQNIVYFDMSNVQSIQANMNILTNQNILDCIILNGNITSSLQLANLNTQKETTTYVYIKNVSPSTDLETLSSTLINKSQSFINNTYVLKHYDKKFINSEINIKNKILFNDIINYHPIIFTHCHFIIKDTKSEQYLVNRNKCSNCIVSFITEYEEQE